MTDINIREVDEDTRKNFNIIGILKGFNHQRDILKFLVDYYEARQKS